MKAVIIAGGLGTRLRPLTYNTPKPIIPVANVPFIIHQIELLKKHGIDEIILNLHYLSDSIRELLGEGKALGVKIKYSIEKDPLGTAGSVKNAEEYFKDESMIIVFNGDVITDINISEIIKFHKSKKASATIALTPVEDPTAYGLVLCDKEGRVMEFLEKPSWERVEGIGKKNINAGIYVLDTQIFRDMPADTNIMFEHQVFPGLLGQNALMYGFESQDYWIDIGNPEKYRQAHESILHGEVSMVKVHGKKDKNGVWVGENSQIDRSAKLFGPAIVGKEAVIGPNCAIKEYSVVGDRVVVGKGSIIENSIIFEGTNIGANAKIFGCIIGFNTKIEDGVVVMGGGVIADNSIITKGTIIGA